MYELMYELQPSRVVCAYDTTRTSPFGHYGVCRCGYVTKTYQPTAKQAWEDVVEHVKGGRTS